MTFPNGTTANIEHFSEARPASIDHEVRACDVIRRIGGKKNNCALKILRTKHSANRYASLVGLDKRLGLIFEITAWANTIGADAAS